MNEPYDTDDLHCGKFWHLEHKIITPATLISSNPTKSSISGHLSAEQAVQTAWNAKTMHCQPSNNTVVSVKKAQHSKPQSLVCMLPPSVLPIHLINKGLKLVSLLSIK